MSVRVTRGNALIGTGNVAVSAAFTVAGAFNVVSAGTFSWNAGTVADGTVTSNAFAATSAALGDTILIGPPIDLQTCHYSASAIAAGTAEIVVQNETGASVTLGTAASTWNYKVIR